MNRYLKLSLLALCGFASIQASRPAASYKQAHRGPKHPSMISYEEFFTRQGASSAQMNMTRAAHRLPHGRASIVLQAASLCLVGYLGKAAIDQYAIYNKNTTESLQIQRESQRMTADQYKISNSNTEEQIQIAQSSNAVAKTGVGASIGAVVGGGVGSAVPVVGTAAGAAGGAVAGAIVAKIDDPIDLALQGIAMPIGVALGIGSLTIDGVKWIFRRS